MAKVVVLGGGVAGLSAAHELIERGFEVEVYERNAAFGGKARSLDFAVPCPPQQKPLPGEHGFRFFPGFYKHVIDTMQRIPRGPAPGSGTVFDNLVTAGEIAITQETKPPWVFAADTPTTIAQWLEAFRDLLDAPNLGVKKEEVAFFVSRLACYMSSCDERRKEQYENQSWYEFIRADLSEAYERVLARGLTLMLVAMKPKEASVNTIAKILVQLLIDIIDDERSPDRVLNQPTNDAWIDPWTRYLEQRKAKLVTGAVLEGVELGPHGVSSARVVIGGTPTVVTGDYFVLAVPVETACKVLTDAQLAMAGIAGIKRLKTEWMNGIVYYLDRDVKLSNGHAIYGDSKWAVTAISQPQFWGGVDLSKYGAGDVKGILSAIVSDWGERGNKTTDKTARECTEAEIKAEVWAQITAHHAQAPRPEQRLDGVTPLHCFLDPAITFPSLGATANCEQLLINTMGSASDRPGATTAIRNLFLAADYVATHTDLATMEAANEAARHAVNGLLEAASSGAPRCRIWQLEEPLLFAPLRKLDAVVYKLNKNSRPPLCHAAPEVLGLGKGKLKTPVQGAMMRWILDPPSRGFLLSNLAFGALVVYLMANNQD